MNISKTTTLSTLITLGLVLSTNTFASNLENNDEGETPAKTTPTQIALGSTSNDRLKELQLQISLQEKVNEGEEKINERERIKTQRKEIKRDIVNKKIDGNIALGQQQQQTYTGVATAFRDTVLGGGKLLLEDRTHTRQAEVVVAIHQRGLSSSFCNFAPPLGFITTPSLPTPPIEPSPPTFSIGSQFLRFNN